MSKKITIALIALCLAMTVCGTTIYFVNKSDNDLSNKTEINLNGDTAKELEVTLTDFYPGSTQTYEIKLKGNSADDYTVTINFRDDEKSGMLENYLTVVISTDKVSIEKSLKELLEGDEISLGKNASNIKIRYTMPESVGNESQGTTADFYIDISAKSVE